jgi:uncharacterized RDD family membrane protein YckC
MKALATSIPGPRRKGSTGLSTLWLVLLLVAVHPARGQDPGPAQTAGSATNTVEPARSDADEATVAAQPDEPEATPALREGGERVSIGGRLKVRADEAVRESVSVFGPSSVEGTVTREMVTVFGNAELSGRVDREMVTVFGKARMTGRVGREMVTVFGDAEVDGAVGRECVAVFGNLKLGPNAKVGRECVAVFGTVERDPAAELEQEPVEVLPMFSGLGEWITDGLLMGRLIPPGSRLAWIVVGLHLVLYALLALLLPGPVRSCAVQLQTRPWLSFGVGLVTMLLLAPVYLVLAAIGVGIVLIPLIGVVETACVCLGKTATFEVMGFQVFRGLGGRQRGAPLMAFLVGFVLVTLLYMVPVLGLLVWLILRPVALGAAVLAGSAALRRNGHATAPGVPVSPPPSSPHPPAASAASANLPPRVSEQASRTEAPPASSPLAMTVLPRAGFWIRMCATGLDFVALCWILLLPYLDSWFLFFWLAYHIGLWSWKGTTIGGIVCNLKLVRLDGRDPDAAVCLVRGLAGIFSALPLLLGFFWAGWTAERQSWHDKIAGTVIVRVPKSISLI